MEEQYVPEENQLTQAEIQKQRNVANNANNVRVAADIASKSANPYAKAIGAAVKAADKLSGGKASMKLGKAMDKANKFSPGGRLLQKASNKMAENGTSDRIGNALKKKKGISSLGKSSVQTNATAEGKQNNTLDRREVEDKTTDGAEVTFKASAKFLKTALFAFAPVMLGVVFMCLIVAASQTFLSVVGLGQADEVSSADADKAIRENGSDGLSDEITDENVDDGSAGDLTWNSYYDVFIDDINVYSNKLTKENFIDSTKYREYNEADLEELEDFYSGVNSYGDGTYNMDTVYKFFFKLYYIQRYYSNDSRYNVDLDMPLIMSVLTVQETDKSKVFEANITFRIAQNAEQKNVNEILVALDFVAHY